MTSDGFSPDINYICHRLNVRFTATFLSLLTYYFLLNRMFMIFSFQFCVCCIEILLFQTDDFADQHIAADKAVKYLTYEKLQCTFPYPTANSRYEVAVSIGATLKRDPDFFAVYDSRCMMCNDSSGNIKIHVSIRKIVTHFFQLRFQPKFRVACSLVSDNATPNVNKY